MITGSKKFELIQSTEEKEHMKNFLRLCKCEIGSIIVLVLFWMFLVYIPVGVICVLLHGEDTTANFISIVVIIVSVIATMVTMVLYYRHNKDYFVRLYNILCMNYKAGDQYNNFKMIRKELYLYEYNGKTDVMKNIEVIKAAVEYDKATNVFTTATVTIFGGLVGYFAKTGIFEKLASLNFVIVYIILILIYIITGNNMPKKYFIQSVAQGIEKEIKDAEKDLKKIERNKEILNLYQSGMSYEKIGRIYNISAHAVEHACLNANCPQEKLFLYIGKNKYIYEYLTENGINSIERLKNEVQDEEKTLENEEMKYIESIMGESKGSSL